MKTAAKVFIWIGIILQGIFVFPIIVGFFALKKINNESPASYKEFAILVCFFCSLLGGIFMLCLDDGTENTESGACKKAVIARIKKQHEIIENEKQARARKKLYFGVILQISLLVLNFVLVIVCVENSSLGRIDVAYALLVSMLHVMLAVLIAIVCLFFVRSKTFTVITNALMCCYALAVLVELLTSVASNYREGYENGLKYWSFGEEWECAVIFAISLVTFIVTVAMLLISIFSKQSDVSIVTHKTSAANNLELEIAEAQRMQGAGVITDAEFKNIRKNIIESYYGKIEA